LVVFRTAGRPSGDRVFSLKSADRPKAVEVSVVHGAADVEALSGLSRFRAGFYECLTARADALFELADGAPRGAVVPDGGERPSIAPPS
jgi:hypothetical protein